MAEPRLEGLPANLALWRLLALRGIRLQLQALEEAVQSDFSVESMVEELASWNLDARTVLAPAEELHHLALPTLIQLRDDQWAVLRACTRDGFRLDQAGLETRTVTLASLSEQFSGLALDLQEPFPDRGGLWTRLLKLLPRYRKPLGQAVAVAMAAQLLALVTPWLTGIALDQALPQAAPSQLQILCLGLILAACFRAWVGWLQETALLGIATHFEATVEKGLFQHLLELPFRYLNGKSFGELMQSFSGLAKARNLLLKRGLSVALSFLMALVYLVYMALVMPGPAVLVLLGALGLCLLTLVVGRLQAQVQRETVLANQAEHSAIAELLNGAATLKATGCQTWAFQRWSERLARGLRHGLRGDRLGLWSEAGNELLNQGLTVTILIWGGYKVLSGELTLGGLMVFVQLSAGFIAAALALAQAGLTFLAQRPQLVAVDETFSTQRQPRAPRRIPQGLPASVVVDEVWFRFGPESPWILQGSSLNVAPGTFHHVKGPSGSGKSTLLKLLAGLYAPDKGSIAVGGLDTHCAASLMLFLPQFPHLGSGSILENLKLFSGGAGYPKLMEVARDTGLDAWVRGLPMGYQTPLASGGGNFSGGQRQLIGITAALASSRPILLLDEALSSLDWVSRSRILRGPHFKGRTVIYASHEEILPD